LPYLADTVTVIRHFSRQGKLGAKAKSILEAVDANKDRLFISFFSFFEIMYSFEKNRIDLSPEDAYRKIIKSSNYKIVPFDMDIVKQAKKTHGLELHDRIIVASALYLNLPLITCDQSIMESGIIETIWN
jgi:PIN domain nuclease of toxin-antitoxin system